jgi:hypothetical protein
MSQVLQWTHFWTFIGNRGPPVLDDFIDAGGAVALLEGIVDGEIHFDRRGGLLVLWVTDLVFLVVGIGEKHRGQVVEAVLAFGAGVVDFLNSAALPRALWSSWWRRVHGAFPRST